MFRIGTRVWLAFATCLLLAGCGGESDVVVIEKTEYSTPLPTDEELLVDDRIEDKQNEFIPKLVDRRPLGEWHVNQSAAVIRLDVPLAKPDSDADLLVLRPSYAASLEAAKEHRSWIPTLPSVNLLDGKAKQFDDGLYAAIDLACFQGIPGKWPSHIELVERLLAKVDPNSPAAAYLAAGLTLGGRETATANISARDELIQRFQASPSISKPIGFYTWSEPLKQCWAFLRFFQQPLEETDPVTTEIVKALQSDASLATDCGQAAQFYGSLTNPLTRLTFSHAVGVDLSSNEAITTLREKKGIRKPGVALFPPSASRETELFERLFPMGVPANANLMNEFVRRIRSGEVDLSPRENSGWYDHQVYALETMLLPERGDEHNKLLLTKPYKKRMLEAFQALITKRRETHVRQLDIAKSESAARSPNPPEALKPRLRVEPCPSYFLRTARSYAFLHEFLTKTLGEENLKSLHGLRKAGPRPPDLASELASQRDLFYGLYLVSCEDIGFEPKLTEAEAAHMENDYNAALAWLEKAANDPDIGEDTRVAVPIYIDPRAGTTRLWVTLGVRLTQLDTEFMTPPQIRPINDPGAWRTPADIQLGNAPFLISVDEFAEVEIPTLSPPNRDELRKLCDQHKTKEKIVEVLSQSTR